jgi:hypothetical protein
VERREGFITEDARILTHKFTHRERFLQSLSATWQPPRCHGRGREFESRRPRHSFQGVIGRDTKNSYPQFHPQLLLHAPQFESYGVQKCFLSRDHLVGVFVCIEVERGLNPRVTQPPFA